MSARSSGHHLILFVIKLYAQNNIFNQKRRFPKLGTTAACVVKSIDLYNKLLEQTSKRSLLVKACQLYLICKFVLCAFKCLAHFTYKIGTYLNMCELSSQKHVKQLLPRFYHELKEQNLSCLDDFQVELNRISIEEPISELAKYMFQKVCDAAADGLRIQRGHEYGFFGEKFNERATIVSEMSDDDLTLIPSHNLDCERDLRFSGIHIKNTSKCSNYHFKAL